MSSMFNEGEVPALGDDNLSEVERNMKAGGVRVDEPAYEDYFGFDESRVWYFPDNVQFIEFKLMDEGARAKYQKATSRDIRLFRQTGDASVKMDAAAEREVLLFNSVVGWNLIRNGRPVDFGQSPPTAGSPFGQWLAHANPKFVNDLEREIRKANSWMNAEMTVEAIDEEIQNLQELRAEAVKREEGK